MRIGAHLSISGGYHKALQNVYEIGGNCLQIFSSSPRIWKHPEVSKEAIHEFRDAKVRLGIDPVYFHATYLINLANSQRGGDASVHALIHELQLAKELGVKGSIIHLGSFNNGHYEALIANCRKVLDNTPTETLFIIENAGTKKVGTEIAEIVKIIRDLKSERVKVCLDTCHLHAAGYDLSDASKFEEFFNNFNEEIGLERLELIHVNDSRDTLGSNRDRHENLGEGNIPSEVFQLLVNHKLTKNLPFILEVPGFDKKGPDKQNLDILKSLVDRIVD